MITKIKHLVSEIKEELVDVRRHLHMYPELSFNEFETSKFIISKLEEWGIDFKAGWVETGIVAEVIGEKKSDKRIALRADIDALPILEKEDRTYRSKNENVMHACGHDVHTTCLLGAIKLLQETRSEWGGTVKCIFQPGEEKLPGGASLMIKEGLLPFMNAEAIVGQHVHPPLDVGKVGFHPGSYMASADELYVKIIGKGGHAALPKDVKDPIRVGAELILAFKQIEKENNEDDNPIVLSIGKFNTNGGATNVVPDQINMEGTFRAMDENKRAHVHQLMEEAALFLSNKFEVKVELEIRHGYPSLYNNPELTEQVFGFAQELLGTSNVVRLPKRMTSEDFSFYSQAMPGCFYRLGVANQEKGITSPVHTSSFDVDEKCLQVGASLMAYSSIKLLGN